jgi:hypothetical protein
MTEISSEAGLRKWLRREWRPEWGPLIWVEAARGGTVGAPDVFVPIPGYGYVPVELKYWPDWKPKMRPAQRRLHTMIGATGFRSAVLSYVGEGKIAVGAGWKISEDLNYLVLWRRELDIDQLRELFLLAHFWKGRGYAKLARASGDEQQRKEHRKRASKAKRRL